MSWWKTSLLAVLLAALGLAQSGADLESPRLNRVARKLQCSCGCNMDMTCRMEPYMCGVCKRFKTQIYALQKAGKTDREVLDRMVQENGAGILAVHPGPWGSILSYTGLAFGLLLVFLFFRRQRSAPAPAEMVDAAMLERYHDQIEKETSKLD